MTGPAALEDLSWADDVQAWIDTWAWSGLIFDADDLRRSFRPPPHGNMFGPAFATAAHRGVIRHVNYKKSTAQSRKHSVIQTWTGVTQGERK